MDFEHTIFFRIYLVPVDGVWIWSESELWMTWKWNVVFFVSFFQKCVIFSKFRLRFFP